MAHGSRLMAHGQWGPARPRCPGAAVGPDPDLGVFLERITNANKIEAAIWKTYLKNTFKRFLELICSSLVE